MKRWTVLASILALAAAAGCPTEPRELGEDCGHDSDCLSELCGTTGVCVTTIGEECGADSHCQSGHCATVCVSELNGECAEDAHCLEGTCDEDAGVCLRKMGEPCGDASECAGGAACEDVNGETVCTAACGRNSDCEDDAVCLLVGTEGACALPPWETGDGTFGFDCIEEHDTACGAGFYCLYAHEFDPFAYCSKGCGGDEDCPTDMLCGEFSVNGGAAQDFCVWRTYCDECLIDAQCPGDENHCIEDTNGDPFCSRACTTTGISCRRDSECLDAGGGDFQCRPNFGACVGDGTTCTPCKLDSDCGTGLCLWDSYAQAPFCVEQCDPDAFACPLGTYCMGITGGSICYPDTYSCFTERGEGELCDGCESQAECAPGNICLASGGPLGLCGLNCLGDAAACPQGSFCAAIGDGYGNTMGFNCVPNTNCPGVNNCTSAGCDDATQYCEAGACSTNAGWCGACDASDEPFSCGVGNLCLHIGGGDYCGQDCSDDPLSCPVGSSCTNIIGGFRQCWPDSDSCV